MAKETEVLTIGDREVTISNPRKVYFPETGHTKLDLVHYYLAVADGALRGAGGRPMALKRFVDGAAGQPFFQKRAPENTPEFVRTATLTFPSGRTDHGAPSKAPVVSKAVSSSRQSHATRRCRSAPPGFGPSSR